MAIGQLQLSYLNADTDEFPPAVERANLSVYACISSKR